MGFFKKFFGIEDDIDFSQPLPAKAESRLMPIRIDVDTAGASKVVEDLGHKAKATTKAIDAAIRKARALKKLTAHGTASRKSKRRSTKKKSKPTSLKRSR